MEFRLLGPVDVVVGGRVRDAGPPRQRLVLAILAAEAGRAVSVESLIDRVWDEPSPKHPRRTLQVYLSRIRQLMCNSNVSGFPPVAVVRRSGGYLLDVAPERVDVHRFLRLISHARHRDCPIVERVAVLRQALELWRGRPLSDLPGQWAPRIRHCWQLQYQETVVEWAQATLLAGDPGAALPRLSELVGEHPLVESLAAVYMRVLYAAGRPAEALDYYTTVQRHLAAELGADPGTELQRLHLRILSADPALAPPAPVAAADSQLRLVPAPPPQL